MRVRRSRHYEFRMSFASMSDIAFLLIIFFAVAGKFTESGSKKVILPSVDLGERTQLRDIEIVVEKDGSILLNSVPVKEEYLNEEVAPYIVPDASREQNTVTVFADRDAEYGRVALAIEAVSKADAYLELAVKQQR